MRKLPKSFTSLHEHITDILEKNRWPKKGDRLLRRSDDWSRGIEFAAHPISRHVHLWDGYLRAAAGLIELCSTEGYEHERHSAIYPILFNYRHGIELAIKWIILMYGGKGIEGVEANHNLWQLWKCCRKIMETAGPTDAEADDAVEQIVKDFHDLDKNGINFRYGWRKDGREIKLPDHMIDLENIRDVMEGIAGYFTGLDGWLSAGP